MPDGYIRLTGGGLNIQEHRYVMEQFLGRKLRKGEQIHHINGIKTDNRIENLLLMRSASHHMKSFHYRVKDDKNYVTLTCAGCGRPFTRLKSEIKRARLHFHSKQCYIDAITRNKQLQTEHKEVV